MKRSVKSEAKGGLLSRERRPPFDPPRERQGRFDLAPAPLTTKKEGQGPSFLDYSPRSSDGAAMPRPHAVRRQTSVTRASRSKARLLDEPTRRDSWRSHVHCTYTAQRVQSFKRPTANVGGRGGRPSSFSGGFKGGILFEKRIPPLSRVPTAGGDPHTAPTALQNSRTSVRCEKRSILWNIQ